jgi:hypothetical protein
MSVGQICSLDVDVAHAEESISRAAERGIVALDDILLYLLGELTNLSVILKKETPAGAAGALA